MPFPEPTILCHQSRVVPLQSTKASGPDGSHMIVCIPKEGNFKHGPGAVHDGGNAASRVAAGLCLWATLLARLLLDF
ncbi:hypothetical protein DV515_00011078 [Chloebia gouldiae]|uniref:Uncharacterized protein n=1 Tax=Chloebia gouldiae TaxID=44316 RepID=A0A3L8S779_CHLGU|nr:hypothetical protein DV515_00011078 [Chloebia gouldiae]